MTGPFSLDLELDFGRPILGHRKCVTVVCHVSSADLWCFPINLNFLMMLCFMVFMMTPS
jgi:hypothetical protein